MNDKRQNDIDELMLMNYLEGKLTPEQQHQVEEAMMESPFLNDAVDGLSIVTNKQRAAVILDELNKEITQKTKSKNSKKIKYNHLIPNMQTLITSATIVILLLVIIGYVLIKMLKHS